jgi:hypothetical protein
VDEDENLIEEAPIVFSESGQHQQSGVGSFDQSRDESEPELYIEGESYQEIHIGQSQAS